MYCAYVRMYCIRLYDIRMIRTYVHLYVICAVYIYIDLCVRMYCIRLYDIRMIQWILINLPQFAFKEYGGLMSLADKLDVHWYLYIILVLGNCD